MARKELKQLNFQFSVRNAPKGGPRDSDSWNDSMEELSNALADIGIEWNTKLTRIIGGLPLGNKDTAKDAIVNGLDGDNMWVDQTVTALSEDLTYFDTNKERPVTVKEALDNLYAFVNAAIGQARTDITNTTGGLTDEQKERIGSNIFNEGDISSLTSLDGKSEKNRLDIVQIAKDLYDESSYTLDGDGEANLTYSIRDVLTKLYDLHGGLSWQNDPAGMSHVITSVTQDSVNSSHPGDDTYINDTPESLRRDLDRIRNTIKVLRGTTTWLTANSELYASGPKTLEDLLTLTNGTSTKTVNNPWGYSWNDPAGLETRLDAIRDFTGQDVHLDTTPGYSSTLVVTQGGSLEQAIGELDAATAAVVVPAGQLIVNGVLDQDPLVLGETAVQIKASDVISSNNKVSHHLWHAADSSTLMIEGRDSNETVYTDIALAPHGGNVGVGQFAFDSTGSSVFAIGEGTAPAGAIAGGIQLWAEDVTTSGVELRVMDEDGNITTLSPHNFDLFAPKPEYKFPWSFTSENRRKNIKINVDMYGALRAIEKLTGEQFIYTAEIDEEDDE